MNVLANLMGGFGIALTPWNLLYAFLGALIGTAIGVLPGLGPPATIALLLPVTYGMNATSAMIMVSGIFYGAMYGGSTTSILLNIPGEASSVVTCLDGYQMARRGRAGPALGISAMGSFIGATVSILLMSMVAPALADLALDFGPAEYTSLVVVGLLMTVYLGGDSIVKGLLMAVLGLVLAMVGFDPIYAVPRFTFGLAGMLDGIDFVVAAMGLFGIAEVLCNMESPEVRDVFKTSLKGIVPTLEDWKKCWASVLRGSALGFFIGVLPGGGAIISSFVAYAVRKDCQASGGVWQGRYRGGGGPGVGEQCGIAILLHSAPDAGNSGQCDDCDDLCGPDDSRDSARAYASDGTSGSFLGRHCLDVCREHNAFVPESAAHRSLGASSEGSLSLSFGGDRHHLHYRSLQHQELGL